WHAPPTMPASRAVAEPGRAPQVGLLLERFDAAPRRVPAVPHLGLLERVRDEEALRLLAAVALQELVLRSGLDALGDHAQAERMRQRNDRLRDRLVVAVLLEAAHEALVDLDALDRQPREVRQRRVAGAEVVDGDRHAHLLQLDER